MYNILDPGKKALKKMGYLKDQKGILRRYFREEDSWYSHIDNCHKFILQELKPKKSEKILVLGSGWLLDFPIEKLSAAGGHITLADVSHPRQILQKIKNFPTVDSLNIDITGGLIEEAYSVVQSAKKVGKKPNLKNLVIPEIRFSQKYDFVVSLNILNQLDILLVDYFKKYWDYTEEETIDFRKGIQEAHLKIFEDNKGILISDTKEIHCNQSGQIINEKEIVYVRLPEEKIKKTWTWDFDTQYLYHKDYRTKLHVEALSF